MPAPVTIQKDITVESNLPVIAGVISTTMFLLSALPMLHKALRTKDLKSYSLGNILLANAGNLVHSVYVFNLPPGPIWLLHSFHLVSTGLMLVWYLSYERRPEAPEPSWHRGARTLTDRFGMDAPARAEAARQPNRL